MPELKWLFQLRTLPHAAIALAACSAVPGALAQTGSAANGEVLYRTDVVIGNERFACRDCHDARSLGQQLTTQGLNEAGVTTRISAAIGANRGGMAVYSSLSAQQRTDIAAYLLAAASAPPPPPFAPPPAPPTPPATPNPVLFNSTEIGSTSATTTILITNSSGSAVSFASSPVTPVEGATTEFLPTVPPTGTWCVQVASLAPGMSCTLGAQFRPSTPGARSTVWIVKFANGVVSRAVTLEGTATGTAAPAPAPSPSPSPSPAPSPAPAPAPAPSAANAPTSGGGGALGWESLLAVAALPAVTRRRRQY